MTALNTLPRPSACWPSSTATPGASLTTRKWTLTLTAAQVHATLALAAATAVGTAGPDSHAWADVAATRLSASKPEAPSVSPPGFGPPSRHAPPLLPSAVLAEQAVLSMCQLRERLVTKQAVSAFARVLRRCLLSLEARWCGERCAGR